MTLPTITKITETKSTDFESLVWHAYSTYLKSSGKVFTPYVASLLRMLDYAIYCMMKASADYEEVAKDPYIYDLLGRFLVYLTRHRRLILNVAEAETGVRPSMSREAYQSYQETLRLARDAADVMAGARACIRYFVTAARAGVFYYNHKPLREVLLMIVERDYDYNNYMDDFLGRFVGEPDAFEPSLDVLNIVLELCLSDFPHEPVAQQPPRRWVEVGELNGGRMKKILVDGWLEVLVVKTMNRVFAMENFCTHEGGFLSDGIVETYSISCIDHLAKFDVRSGRVLTQPHHGLARPLATFPVKMEQGKLYVGLYVE
ncbi:MAG: Rieske (2Fe-2S) protein [Candidatus Caldarchaeum sp.]|nr:Rieske (2Fe-2S) protein [Candidatus Caldarchaeum sp.]